MNWTRVRGRTTGPPARSPDAEAGTFSVFAKRLCQEYSSVRQTMEAVGGYCRQVDHEESKRRRECELGHELSLLCLEQASIQLKIQASLPMDPDAGAHLISGGIAPGKAPLKTPLSGVS